MAYIESATKTLHRLFRLLNKNIFNNELIEPALLIQHQGKKENVLGWCSGTEIWKNTKGDYELFEITICAEYLDRGVIDISATLLHEMVHLYCSIKKIDDCTFGYHNKKFRDYAIRFGLAPEFIPGYGWAKTTLQPRTKKLIEGFKIKKDVFSYSRLNVEGSGKRKRETKKQTLFKYKCKCGTTIRNTKPINIMCMDCSEPFKEVVD